jgi:hypothetical protein
MTSPYNTGTVVGFLENKVGSNYNYNYSGTAGTWASPPSTTINAAWGIGNAPSANQYWKNYTGNAGMPQLWFE